MNLPTGNWNLNANGSTRTLTIKGIGVNGKLDITLQGIPVIGYWDEKSHRILFHNDRHDESVLRKMGPTKRSNSIETFVGYLLELNREHPGLAPTLAGYFDNQVPSEPRQDPPHPKKTYGWYAQLKTHPEGHDNLNNTKLRSAGEMIKALI
jgi:hypothetical protein